MESFNVTIEDDLLGDIELKPTTEFFSLLMRLDVEQKEELPELLQELFARMGETVKLATLNENPIFVLRMGIELLEENNNTLRDYKKLP